MAKQMGSGLVKLDSRSRPVLWVVTCTLLLVSAGIVLAKVFHMDQAHPGPWLEFDKTEVNVGHVHSLANAKVSFRLTNIGSEAVQFGKPAVSCWCLEPLLPTNSLAPGQSMIVEVGLKERSDHGRFLEQVDLPTNDPRIPRLRLVIKGEVRPIVAVDPSHLVFGAIRRGAEATRRVELVSHDGEEFSIQHVDLDPSSLSVEYLKGVSGLSNRILMTFRPTGASPSRLDGNVIIKIDHPITDHVVLPVRAEVLPDFAAIPPRLLALLSECGGLCNRSFEIEGPSEVAPEVKEIKITEGIWELENWSLATAQAERRVRIDLVLRGPDYPGLHMGSLQVTCQAADPEEEEAIVLVRFGGIVRSQTEKQVPGVPTH